MANLKNLSDPDPELTAAKNLMSRRESIAGAAKLVAGRGHLGGVRSWPQHRWLSANAAFASLQTQDQRRDCQ
jgi:hypothetical protein